MRYFLLIMSLLLGSGGMTWAQVARVEYFVDADPGLGLATPVPVTPGNDITSSFTVPLTTVAPGFHALYLRTRDAQQHWSLTAAQSFFTAVLAPTNQALAKAEYFIDQEPGLGQAISIPLGTGQPNATLAFNVSLVAVSPGFHTLYLRTRDAQGAWSHTLPHTFYTVSLPPANQALARAEYFIDQDPGAGQGTLIPLGTGQPNATLAFNVSLATSSPGFHTLYLRTRDAQGAWSLTQPHTFYTLSLSPANQALARAEYFIDQDPGAGQGTAIPLGAGQQNATLAFNVSLAGTPVGAHVLYARVADKAGAWSAAAAQAFLVKPGGNLVTITAFKYVFARAGFVSDTLTYQVPTPAPSVSLSFAANLSSLPGDLEYDMSIWAVGSNGLRSLVQVKRIKACNSLPVKAGFEFAQEGHQVYFVNGSANASTQSWDFGDGSTSTLANPQHTYAAIGNYSVRLVSASLCNADTVTKTVSIQGLKAITTNHGGNTGAVSVVVTGAGFVPGMQLLLRRAGQADIVGDTVITRSLGEMTTRFNLAGKATGLWDVVASYPGGPTVSLPNGFAIEAGVSPQLAVLLSGSTILRIGFNQIYTITYSNQGNVDADKVPLFIGGLPLGTTIEVVSPIVNPDVLPGLGPLHLTSYLPRRTWDDAAHATSYRVLFLDRIPAGFSGTVSVVCHVPVTTPLRSTPNVYINIGTPASHFYAGTGGGGAGGNPLNDAALCDLDLVEHAIVEALNTKFPGQLGAFAQISGFQPCAVGIAQTIFDKFGKPRLGLSTPETRYGKVIEASDYTAAVVSLTESCYRAVLTGLGAAVSAYAGQPEFLEEVMTLNAALYKVQEKYENKIATPLSYFATFNNCLPLFKDATRQFLRLIIGNASDPNAKYGPGAGSAHHYINKDAPLAYTINFENLPTANINAQTVRVTDTLSTQAFDLASFAFTAVTVGEQTYALPAPAKSFVHDFDFVAQYGVKARVVGTFEAATGIARWTFFTIDPATNQVTTNALAGFLPPDVVSPRGQGYVSFTVQANAARQTGDVIRNRAAIVFDFNPVIRTNAWPSTFDLVRPVSSVTAVVPAQATNLQVSWTGADVGSGIQGYDIYYTTNGRNARKWLSGTGLTTSLFTGQRDSTYCFYSIARDSAGNVEATPALPGVCRAVVLGQLSAAAPPDQLVVYPNPTPGIFTVETTTLRATTATLTVEDVVGHVVYRRELVLPGGPRRQPIDASHLAAGVYFVRLTLDGQQVVRKLLKE